MPRNKKSYIKKDVLGGKLLAALEDDSGKCAIVCSEVDLNLLIDALDALLDSLPTYKNHPDAPGKPYRDKAKGMRDDLLELKESTFHD